MTKLYVVSYGWDYEGGKIVGIYDNKKQANAKVKQLRTISEHQIIGNGDYQGIDEITLNKDDEKGFSV